MRMLFLAILTTALISADDPQPKPKVNKPGIGFWAAISTNSPLYIQKDPFGSTKFEMCFAVVNDGDKTADPEIGSSELIVNGVPMKEWGQIVHTGPGPRNPVLAPAQSLRFGYTLREQFSKPGIYKVVWKNKLFESPEITIRVLPGKP